MQPVQIYGLALLAVIALTFLARDKIAQQAGALVLVGWSFSRLAEGGMGFEHAPYVVPTFDALLAVGLGLIGYRSRSALCFSLVLLYLAQETIAAVVLPTQRQGEAWYYALNSGIFVLKLLALGGWSIASLVVGSGRGGVGLVPGRVTRRKEP